MTALLKKAKDKLRCCRSRLGIKKRQLFMRCCRIFPVDKNKAVFMSYQGKFYNDNPRAVFEELVRQRPDMKCVWLISDENAGIKHARTVLPYTYEAWYHLATAGLWVDNMRKEKWLPKRRKQYYVQTWHGSIALKKVEKDTEDTLSPEYIASAKHDSEMADLFIAGNRWRAENFRNAFWYNGRILLLGLPKSDIFYKDPAPYHRKVCRFFGAEEDTRFCVYLPTFRKDGSVDCYDIDYRRLHKALVEKWGGSWRILVRLHPNIKNRSDELSYDSTVLNATSYKETNELTAASELLITDYSSCMFDGLEAGKRVLIYASDVAEYMNERDLYFKLEELPFPVAENNDGLIGNVLGFDDEAYERNTAEFKEQLGFCNGPDSSEKVVSYILNELNGGNEH